VLDFTVLSDSRGTLLLAVAVRSSACEIKSNLPFEHSRSSIGNIAIEQN